MADTNDNPHPTAALARQGDAHTDYPIVPQPSDPELIADRHLDDEEPTHAVTVPGSTSIKWVDTEETGKKFETVTTTTATSQPRSRTRTRSRSSVSVSSTVIGVNNSAENPDDEPIAMVEITPPGAVIQVDDDDDDDDDENEDAATRNTDAYSHTVVSYPGADHSQLRRWSGEAAAAHRTRRGGSMSDDGKSHSEHTRGSNAKKVKTGGKGLSSNEALRKLLDAATSIIDEERHLSAHQIHIISYLRRPETFCAIIFAIALIAFYVYGFFFSSPYQFRLTAILVEALLIEAMLVWNGYLYQREKRLSLREITDRADTIMEALERSGMDMPQDTRIPFVPSLSTAKVIRDGIGRVFPTNLLVEGDVVEMLLGDTAPCRMKYLPPDTTTTPPDTTPGTDYYLDPDQVFKPSFFGISPPSDFLSQHTQLRGRHHFVLLDTPLEQNLRAALCQERPATVIHNEANVLVSLFVYRLLWCVLAVALVINLLRFTLKDYLVNGHSNQGFEVLVVLPIYAILPLLPLSFPTLWIVARSYGNAKVLVLFEALQISKTEYADDDEVDEFDDEAPPPTKNVVLDSRAVWSRFGSLLTKWDRLSLTRSTNLFESLGSTTVICCIDREGTISNPFPTVEQIVFPNVEDDITILEVAEDATRATGIRFEDQDWSQHLPCLKPLGLNLLLNTNCGVLRGQRRSEHHRKRVSLHLYGKTQPARQSCVCRLGKEIGFTDDALKSFVRRKEIYTFAPYHECLAEPLRNYQFEVPSMLSSVYEETNSETYQLLSDGHLELILDLCSDYWDGEGLQVMNEAMEKKIYDFYQTAVVNDMQCVAYAYRPINTVNNSRIAFLDHSTNPNDPGFAFHVLPYSPLSVEDEDAAEAEKGEAEVVTVKRRRKRDSNLEPVHDFVFGEDALEEGEKDLQMTEKETTEGFYRDVVKGQIFLSVATLCHRPKLNVVDFIEDLGLAGIRFVYFSPTAERESKAYAERLGLETDWNSCILLSSADSADCGTGYLQSHDIKARLPRGIDKIRPHLENVDDIPLHVSLFAECTPEATREMIRIFQEYGEVVCCIGNALNAKNTASFALADVSIAMEPMHTKAQSKGRLNLNGVQPPLAIGASLVSLPCGLFMQYETSLYALTQLIGEARRLLSGLRMGFAFLAGSFMSISLMLLISYCMLLPPILTGYQILWLVWIVCPILALSMLFSPQQENIMSTMPGKNIEHLKDRWRFMLYFVARFSLPIIMCLVIYILSLLAFSEELDVALEFGAFGRGGWLHWTSKEEWAVLYAQNIMLVVFVWYLACISATFMHRTLSVRQYLPFRNRVWVGAVFACIALQLVFCALSLFSGPHSFESLPWHVYVLGFVWPVIFLPVQELVKMHDNKEYTRFQKRSKLEFNTKLGMHSPL